MHYLQIRKRQLTAFIAVAIKGGVRDRVLTAMVVVGLLLLLTTPVVAVFSMRQVLALATSYSLSIIGLMGLLLTLFMAMSLLARSGGIDDEFTFTGGVARNRAAVTALRELVEEHYGERTVNISPDSIYTGALGAALCAQGTAN